MFPRSASSTLSSTAAATPPNTPTSVTPTAEEYKNSSKYFLHKKYSLIIFLILLIWTMLDTFVKSHIFAESHYQFLIDLISAVTFAAQIAILFGIIADSLIAVGSLAAMVSLLVMGTIYTAANQITPWTLAAILIGVDAIAFSLMLDIVSARRALQAANKTNNNATHQRNNPYQRFNDQV